MATKNYMINDKWLDLDKQNIVELQSVDGVLDSMKVNGSEIVTPSGKITITENGTDIDIAQYATADVAVEGGGGSSDFSTVEVTIYNNSGDDNVTVSAVCINNDKLENIFLGITGYSNNKIYAVLYKGESAGIDISHGTSVISISGDITYDEETFMYYATGDCTISFNPA